MRILLLVVYYLPSTTSSAKLMSDLATEFHRLGHEVIVVAPDETILNDMETSVENGDPRPAGAHGENQDRHPMGPGHQ